MTRKEGRRQPRKSKRMMTVVKGVRIGVPNHPPEFMAVPWYRLTVRIDNPGTAITYGNLFSAIVSQLQLGVPNSELLNIRLIDVRVWGPIPVTNVRLTLTVRDVFDSLSGTSPLGGQATLEEISDYPDQVNRARVGFRYSSIQQQRSIFTTGNAPGAIFNVAGAGQGSVMYVNLLWRTYRASGGAPVLQEDSDSEVEIISTKGSRRR